MSAADAALNQVVVNWRGLEARRQQQRAVLEAHLRGVRFLLTTAQAEARGDVAPAAGATGTVRERLDTVGALLLDAKREFDVLGRDLEMEYALANAEVRAVCACVWVGGDRGTLAKRCAAWWHCRHVKLVTRCMRRFEAEEAGTAAAVLMAISCRPSMLSAVRRAQTKRFD